VEGYLDETIVDVKNSEYKDYDEKDWALLYIKMYNGIDGAHHKDWLLDQVARILKGTEMIVKIAKWDNGHTEDRFNLGESSQAYLDWVVEMKDGEDGPDTYLYEVGVAP